ncbi:hypothetical protein ID866_10042, partial [Astraeus odoratus]
MTPESSSSPSSSSQPSGPNYPPQRHAGAVGIGPEFGTHTGFTEKLAGLKEEIKGKVLRKPELVQHGHDRRTGELRKKEREQVRT